MKHVLYTSHITSYIWPNFIVNFDIQVIGYLELQIKSYLKITIFQLNHYCYAFCYMFYREHSQALKITYNSHK